jgi:hypothetical protein
MSISSGIEYHPICPQFSFMERVDQIAFVIGLVAFEVCAQFFPALNQLSIDVTDRQRTIDLWFTGAKQIQIWSMQD